MFIQPVRNLGIEIPLIFVERLYLFHIGLHLFEIENLSLLDRNQSLDIALVDIVGPLNVHTRNQRQFFQCKFDDLSLITINHLRCDVLEVSHLIDGLYIGGKMFLRDEGPPRAL